MIPWGCLQDFLRNALGYPKASLRISRGFLETSLTIAEGCPIIPYGLLMAFVRIPRGFLKDGQGMSEGDSFEVSKRFQGDSVGFSETRRIPQGNANDCLRVFQGFLTESLRIS